LIRNRSNKELWDRIYNGFDNKICNDCCKQLSEHTEISYPQPIPYIGNNFNIDETRLMFVGIESYCNDPRTNCDKTYYDKFPTEQVERLFFKKKESGVANSPFWNWVREISTRVLSPERKHLCEAFSRIAYSNLHKCQSRKKGSTMEVFCRSNYRINEDLSRNCIQKAGWIYHEIEEIDAKNIIVFAGRKNDGLLARIFLGDDSRYLKKFDYSKYYLTPRTREMRKDRDVFVHLKDGNRRFIVTNHPQGTPNEIQEEIIRIIKENDWSGAKAWKMPETKM